MSRLTKPNTYINNLTITKKELFDCYDKLEKIEDLMEKYKINSIEELENILIENSEESHVVQAIKYGMDGAISIVGKGMLYNILSEELGCSLEVVFKAYKETIVFKKIDCITKKEHVLEGVKNKLIYNGKEFVLHTCFKYKKYYYLHILELKDYKKTWWLKGDKDE